MNFASLRGHRARRRGIILVVVLGMLGLLALIGVTFAAFSGQAQVNARNFNQAQNFPDATEVMDYALSQLIGDTANPASVIRAHSLLRDMYGNDAAYNGPLLTVNPESTDYSGSFLFSNAKYISQKSDLPGYLQGLPLVGSIQYTTNIPLGGSTYYGMNFSHWLVRFPQTFSGTTYLVGRTLEVMYDDQDAGNVHVFYVPPANNGTPIPTTATNVPGPDPSITGYTPADPSFATINSSTLFGASSNNFVNVAFALDGRYLRAFNGPGIGTMGSDEVGALQTPVNTVLNRSLAEYGNWRYNGNIFNNAINSYSGSTTRDYSPGWGDPNQVASMDEDYDACDLENWFLAIQSADGQVVIPSFHRPGILTASDWQLRWTNSSNSWNAATQAVTTRAMSRILRPRRADGHDPISFPDLTPGSDGKIVYDVDNDGDGVTDAVWLDLGYPPRRNSQGQLFKPLFAFTVIGLNGKLPLNTAGNLNSFSIRGGNYHAEHLGTSPSEIDLRFALQNGFDPKNSAMGTNGHLPNEQFDNAYIATVGDSPVNVSLTQLRNLLQGTRLPDATGATNMDWNTVYVNGKPELLPNGVYDGADNMYNGTTTVNAGTNGYTGSVLIGTPTVAGRWGEEDYVPNVFNARTSSSPGDAPFSPDGSLPGTLYAHPNVIGPGRSVTSGPTASWDSRDDNYNGFDIYPMPYNPGPPPTGTNTWPAAPLNTPETADYYDPSGSLALPVERIRRFVTPFDLNGSGAIVTPNPQVATNSQVGADLWGRVWYRNYFRAPGIPLQTWFVNDTQVGTVPPITTPATVSIPVFPDVTNNLYHGFTSYMSPSGTGNALMYSAAPSNVKNTASPPTAGSTVPRLNATGVWTVQAMTETATPGLVAPSFDLNVLSMAKTSGHRGGGVGGAGSAINDADEMTLYSPSRFDAPFGPSDLEWLYRAQDVDGPALQSRLKDLAPISFVKSIDANRRRRLFALDSWDVTNFCWTTDNPQNAFPSNHRFTPFADAGFQAAALPTPSVAHRDRRINLNFPFPVSNSPREPVRQKWIRETYQLLKAILPPKAIDTPEELAQLSQFVVNMVDFRDPDCTMTKFVNTDVWVTEPNHATAPGVAATLSYPTTPATVAYDVTLYDPLPTDTTQKMPQGHYLVQYGMEYQPVAINEVLAVKYQTGLGSQVTTPSASNYTARFFFELVNTLTQDALTGTPESSNLDLKGWDFVVMPDDETGRPDPVTGQIPLQTDPTRIKAWAMDSTGPITTKTTSVDLKLTTPIPSLQGSNTADTTASYYYVFGNKPQTAPTNTPDMTNLPTISAPINIDPTKDPCGTAQNVFTYLDNSTPPVPKPVDNAYYWLYIRRPPNPFDRSFDPTNPNANRVVVDSFRFVYTKSTTMAYTDSSNNDKTNPGTGTGPVTTERFFSLQRMQPYRGGHAVPPLIKPGVPPLTGSNYVVPAYGFQEQTDGPPQLSTVSIAGLQAWNIPTASRGRYRFNAGVDTTTDVLHSLGRGNILMQPPPAAGTTVPPIKPGDDWRARDMAWDYFPFNDRDFTSVTELTMVPSCSPGLFTKQFVEDAPPIGGTIPVLDYLLSGTPPFPGMLNPSGWSNPSGSNRTVWDPTVVTSGAQRSTPNQYIGSSTYTTTTTPAYRMVNTTHTMPYLNDEFFYTGMSEPAAPTAAAPTQGWPDPTSITPPANTNPRAPIVSAASGNYIGGPGGAGYHKMLEFFEVPSPMLGSIGPVSQGMNYDWMRQDLKPGQLNLNLIIDEEVFLGLMGESMYGNPFDTNNTKGYLDQWQCTLAIANHPPAVVTQVDQYGAPTLDSNGNLVGAYEMPNVGSIDLAPGWAAIGSGFTNYLKSCFTDFLKLRHGGSGYIYGWGNGPTGGFGQVDTVLGRVPIASDRPYRSLSYPDINYTILRPAALTPSVYTTPVANPLPGAGYAAWTGGNGITALTQDPGLKSPYLYTKNNPIQPPPVPPRRLFQVADSAGRAENASTGPSYQYTNPNDSFSWLINSTLSGTPPTPVFPPVPTIHTGASAVNWQIVDNTDVTNTSTATVTRPFNPFRITNPNMDLVAGSTVTAGVVDDNYLGGGGTFPVGTAAPHNDQRDHPYFRTEWMQKMMNLTTVRTHQYAVWITVGFFEVTRAGDAQLANVPFSSNVRVDSLGRDKAYDILGKELGVLDGTNVRYRGFFLVDRTKAIGFNPALPGDFRDMVVYRQLIEGK